MNTKRKTSILVVLGSLVIAAWAYAQMAISTDGVTFPDGTVQMTAAARPGSITEFLVVGFTTDETDGSIFATTWNDYVLTGISAMHELCRSDFGPGARAAFANERLAPGLDAPYPDAWVIPTNIEYGYSPDGTDLQDWFAFDTASGARSAATSSPSTAYLYLTCGNYTEITGRGSLNRFELGVVAIRSCVQEHPIACSAPVTLWYDR